MADYVKNFGSRFVGLTGSPEAIAAAAKAYRVAYSKFQKDKMQPAITVSTIRRSSI